MGAERGRRVDEARVLAPLALPLFRSGEASGGGLRFDYYSRSGVTFRQSVARIVRAARDYDALLLNGSGRWDQAAAAVLGLRGSRTPIVMTDCTWKRGGTAFERWSGMAGLRAIDRAPITYCVLSRAEVEAFPRTWRVDPARVVFTPFHHTLEPEELERPTAPGTGVFAGGDSMRDYEPLLEAARGLDAQVTLATGVPQVTARRDLPANVRAGRVPHEQFVRLLRESAVVVVPLAPGIERSAGQQTYLNAMALRRTVIVTDGPGVRDYVEDGVTGFVVPPRDPAALAAALRHALDPANADSLAELHERARAVVLDRFTPDAYARRLVQVVRERLRLA